MSLKAMLASEALKVRHCLFRLALFFLLAISSGLTCSNHARVLVLVQVLRFLLQRGEEHLDVCHDFVKLNELNPVGVAQVLTQTYVDQVQGGLTAWAMLFFV